MNESKSDDVANGSTRRPFRSQSPPIVRTRIPVRWSDQDSYGHVNNARVVTLLEEARIVWRRQAIDVDGCTGLDGPIVVASMQLDYRRSIEFGQDVEIDVRVKCVGTKSYTLQYEAYQDGHLVLEGSTIHVHLNKETLRARKLQPEELDYLSRSTMEPMSA